MPFIRSALALGWAASLARAVYIPANAEITTIAVTTTVYLPLESCACYASSTALPTALSSTAAIRSSSSSVVLNTPLSVSSSTYTSEGPRTSSTGSSGSPPAPYSSPSYLSSVRPVSTYTVSPVPQTSSSLTRPATTPLATASTSTSCSETLSSKSSVKASSSSAATRYTTGQPSYSYSHSTQSTSATGSSAPYQYPSHTYGHPSGATTSSSSSSTSSCSTSTSAVSTTSSTSTSASSSSSTTSTTSSTTSSTRSTSSTSTTSHSSTSAPSHSPTSAPPHPTPLPGPPAGSCNSTLQAHGTFNQTFTVYCDMAFIDPPAVIGYITASSFADCLDRVDDSVVALWFTFDADKTVKNCALYTFGDAQNLRPAGSGSGSGGDDKDEDSGIAVGFLLDGGDARARALALEVAVGGELAGSDI